MSQDEKDLYAVLGVPRDASPGTLREAFQTLALRHHPDRAGGETGAFQEIAAAYKVLSEPETRERYDRRRCRPAASAPPRPVAGPRPEPLRGGQVPGAVGGRPTLVLDRRTAMWGGSLTVLLPLASPCPWCQGVPGDPFCACAGRGRILRELPLRLRLPPMIRDGAVFPLEIPGVGVIEIEIRVG